MRKYIENTTLCPGVILFKDFDYKSVCAVIFVTGYWKRAHLEQESIFQIKQLKYVTPQCRANASKPVFIFARNLNKKRRRFL